MAGSKGESEKGVMMAKENVKNFYEVLVNSKELQEKLKELEKNYTGDVNDRRAVAEAILIPAAKEAGYEFTVEELKSVEKERAEEGAVSEEEMELVGGGLDGVCVLIGSSMDFEQSADASYQKGAHACAFLGVGFGYW